MLFLSCVPISFKDNSLFYSVGKNKKKGDVSDEELDDSKSTVSTASKSTAKASKKKKGNYRHFYYKFSFASNQMTLICGVKALCQHILVTK